MARWNKSDTQILQQNLNLPFNDLAKLFPKKTNDSVRSKMQRLNKSQGDDSFGNNNIINHYLLI